MTANRPAHVDLAGDTDLWIKALAERADAKVSGSVKWGVMPPTELTTNASGDVVCTFPGLTWLYGAVIYAAKRVKLTGTTDFYPYPPVGYIVSPRDAYPVMITLNPAGNPGTCWARIFVGGWQYPRTGTPTGWVPAEPARGDQKINIGAIAWGPP